MARFLSKPADCTCRGFSLVEALISLLVLSIGMLGLGQLQARLWSSQGDLQRLNQAYLAAENQLLLTEIAGIFTTNQSNNRTDTARFNENIYTRSTELLMFTTITLDWAQSRQQQTLTLQSITTTDTPINRSRWLLPLL